MLNHPRQMQHVFIDHAPKYRKTGGMKDPIRALLGNGLVVSEGAFWLRQRRMLQPHFHRQRLAGMVDTMVHATAEGLQAWERRAGAPQPFDVKIGLEAVTMRVVARALFGQDLTRDGLGPPRAA